MASARVLPLRAASSAHSRVCPPPRKLLFLREAAACSLLVGLSPLLLSVLEQGRVLRVGAREGSIGLLVSVSGRRERGGKGERRGGGVSRRACWLRGCAVQILKRTLYNDVYLVYALGH
jgi:hypothetical protein